MQNALLGQCVERFFPGEMHLAHCLPLDVARGEQPHSLESNLNILMKRIFFSLIAASSLVSCATGPNAQTGTVVGALGGAAAGGIIGNQSGRGLEGAAIGAGLGALAGNAIGNSQDQRNYQRGRYYHNGRYYNQRGYRNSRYYYY
ncbi:hypothetical protein GCM10023213_31030 [Prosthecobacter algae]|uniref:Glycine zipper domain-containing protein n=2 Tax=Prosthecobacter algae TaxID=1144682 RepID=A0ABP9PAF3_9BACT